LGRNSSIEWTHHTFNPWWGCTKVSPACKHCYAEAWAKRLGMDIWGGRSSRRFFSDSHWREPVRWNAEAAEKGIRRRVFCASMADVFEGRLELDPWRERLWELIAATPALDWLLLTKRPERVRVSVPWKDVWPHNVWLGTTVENQHWADVRIPELVKYKAVVRFLSCEPLLGPLDLERWLGSSPQSQGIDWVIVGGESGARSRPMNPDFCRNLRDQCANAGVAFHFKQWGNWRPETGKVPKSAKRLHIATRNGVNVTVVRLHKAEAGRDLDGRTWDGLPTPRRVDPQMQTLPATDSHCSRILRRQNLLARG
jgi:protein gp37